LILVKFKSACYLNHDMNTHVNPNQIGLWIESFDELAAEAKLREIDAAIARLQRERSWVADALALRQRWDAAHADATNPPTPKPSQPTMIPAPEAHVPLDGPPPTGKTAAVLRILGSNPNRTWKSQEIRQIMVERGWMSADDKDYASLMSTLSRMSGNGVGTTPTQIYRPARGHYRLGPPTESEP